MPCLFSLLRQLPGLARLRWLLLLLGVSSSARAQVSPRLPALPPQATTLARQQAARPRWPADSLGRLLVYVRLAHAFRAQARADSAARYLGRAWRLAGARQGQLQPTVVIALADDLAGCSARCALARLVLG